MPGINAIFTSSTVDSMIKIFFCLFGYGKAWQRRRRGRRIKSNINLVFLTRHGQRGRNTLV